METQFSEACLQHNNNLCMWGVCLLLMQVAAILAKMEVCGVACAPRVLSDHRATLAARLAAIKGRATQLVGRNFNLSSSSQLAKVLYEDLRLTPRAGGALLCTWESITSATVLPAVAAAAFTACGAEGQQVYT